MNIPVSETSTASATKSSSMAGSCRRTGPPILTRGARPCGFLLNTAVLILRPLLDRSSGRGNRKKCVLFQISLGAQRRLDPRPRIAYLQSRGLPGELFDQLDVPRRELCAYVVGDVGRGPVALVPALVDEPLADEFLVEHPLILAALEPLLASFRDPVAARVGSVDLVDHPDLAHAVDAKLVLRIDQDETAPARPVLPRGEERQRISRQ